MDFERQIALFESFAYQEENEAQQARREKCKALAKQMRCGSAVLLMIISNCMLRLLQGFCMKSY